MIFTETSLQGVFLVDLEPVRDEGGMFMRTWCQREFEAHGLSITWVQSSVSVNTRKGTLRGLHYQSAPHEEVKEVGSVHGGNHLRCHRRLATCIADVLSTHRDNAVCRQSSGHLCSEMLCPWVSHTRTK